MTDLTPAEAAAAEHFARACNRDDSNPARDMLGSLGHHITDAEPSQFADQARALVAALRPILADENTTEQDVLLRDLKWLLSELGSEHWRDCDLSEDDCHVCTGYQSINTRWATDRSTTSTEGTDPR